MPDSIELGPTHRTLSGHVSPLEIIAQPDMVRVIDAWRRAKEHGAASTDINLVDDPDADTRLHLVDVSESHGVMIGVLAGSARRSDGPSVTRHYQPRRAAVRKDSTSRFVEVDPAFTRILGWEPAEVLDVRAIALLGSPRATTVDAQLSSVLPVDRPALEAALTAALTAVLDGEAVDLEVWTRRARRCHLRLRPIHGPSDDVTGAVVSVTDVTEDARLRDELRRRATYDALTQCLNRAAILDALGEALATGESGTSVVFFDIDHFKEINDERGRDDAAGVAQRLADAVQTPLNRPVPS
ncbi:diguanylate cyclase domain-containing protein [Cryptosporangium sp. NPDC051539]|uniref:diguanylate cyclase domain-containing protein n=1 Tax=Cryptosporangium sp. NPDC051539 TaxID=3363962 RepID=UPI0037AE9281